MQKFFRRLFRRGPQGKILKLELEGLHCTSCCLDIDDTLESLPGIFASSCNYRKSQVEIDYEDGYISIKEIRQVIHERGYKTKVIED